MPQKALTSKAFKAQTRTAGKEFRDGTVGEALDDLYEDIDAGFNALEQATIAAGTEAGGGTVELNAASIVALNVTLNAVIVALKAAGIVADA
jgi:hypothetical protein